MPDTENKTAAPAAEGAPKGSAAAAGQASSAEGTPAGGAQPQDKAASAGSSSSEGKQPPKIRTPEEQLDIAAKAERGAAKRRAEADREVAEAKAAAEAAKVEAKKELDAHLAKLGRAALANEKLSKGEKLAAIKELMGEAYNPQELLEAMSLDVKVPGEDDAGDKPPTPEQLEAAIDKRIDEREAKKTEEATAAATTKKADDQKAADEYKANLRKQFDVDVFAALDGEKHPQLKALFDTSLDMLSEEDAKAAFGKKAFAEFVRVHKEKGEALEPGEVVDLLELTLTEKRSKKAKPRTTDQEIDAELEALDRRQASASTSDDSGAFTKADETASKPNTRVIKTGKTMVDWAHEQCDALDRKAGDNRLW